MKRKRIRKRSSISALTRISFLPSVFTMLNLFLGYQALIYIIGAKQNFKIAIYYITASVIMDGFDGTIARLTKTESNFGVQLDSLVDAVTFGLVTSMLAFEWGFQSGYHPDRQHRQLRFPERRADPPGPLQRLQGGAGLPGQHLHRHAHPHRGAGHLLGRADLRRQAAADRAWASSSFRSTSS